jgi:hypothetical protein
VGYDQPATDINSLNKRDRRSLIMAGAVKSTSCVDVGKSCRGIVALVGSNETEDALGERPKWPIQRSVVEGLADALLDWARKPIFEPIELFPISTWLEDLNRRQTELHAGLTRGQTELRAALMPAASWFAVIQQIKLLNEARWIAHPALPIGDLIGEQSDPEKVGETVVDYVEQHLQEIYEILESRFSNYNSGDQTKAFALELVQAHRHGLFHLIVPAVFPEIERCARNVLGLGAGKKPQAVINALTEEIDNLTISKIGSLHALSALLMIEYFYKSIYSESDADKF